MDYRSDRRGSGRIRRGVFSKAQLGRCLSPNPYVRLTPRNAMRPLRIRRCRVGRLDMNND
eukprot:2866793-Alexandrium_andersonii.AAC.1